MYVSGVVMVEMMSLRHYDVRDNFALIGIESGVLEQYYLAVGCNGKIG